jgi:hypothetical protein
LERSRAKKWCPRKHSTGSPNLGPIGYGILFTAMVIFVLQSLLGFAKRRLN